MAPGPPARPVTAQWSLGQAHVCPTLTVALGQLARLLGGMWACLSAFGRLCSPWEGGRTYFLEGWMLWEEQAVGMTTQNSPGESPHINSIKGGFKWSQLIHIFRKLF